MRLLVLLAVLAAVGVVMGWPVRKRMLEEQRLFEEQARWRARSRRAHAGRCPWSGRPGYPTDSILYECPRCGSVFVAGDPDRPNILPEHRDDRSA